MKNYISCFCVAIVCMMQMLCFVSCKSDEDDGGQPVITGVRAIDPEKADSLFTESDPWDIIVLVGRNLGGAKEIYINDQKVSFNPTYATSTHIILSIPGELKLVGANPELKSEIRVVTSHSTATYAFHINSPAPYLISYTADWTDDMPLSPGQEIRIKGENFYEVESLYLTDFNPLEVDDDGNPVEPEGPVTKYEITDYEIGADFDLVTAKLPATVLEKGYIVIECHSGSSVIGFSSAKPNPPVIEDISSDMPVWGEPCTLFGKEFNDPVAIIIGKNEITIPAKDITVNDDKTQLTFTLPTLPEKGGRLILVTEQGRDTIPFYQKSTVLIDFDSFGRYFWGGTDSGKVVDQTSANNKPANTSGQFWGIEGTTQLNNGWWGPLYLGESQIPDIPESTPIEDIEFRYECYMHYPEVEGMECWFILCDGSDFKGQYMFNGYHDRITGKCETGRWMSCSIPLRNLVTGGSTYGDIRLSLTSVYLHLCNGLAEQDVAVYFDNFRLYVRQ